MKKQIILVFIILIGLKFYSQSLITNGDFSNGATGYLVNNPGGNAVTFPTQLNVQMLNSSPTSVMTPSFFLDTNSSYQIVFKGVNFEMDPTFGFLSAGEVKLNIIDSANNIVISNLNWSYSPTPSNPTIIENAISSSFNVASPGLYKIQFEFGLMPTITGYVEFTIDDISVQNIGVSGNNNLIVSTNYDLLNNNCSSGHYGIGYQLALNDGTTGWFAHTYSNGTHTRSLGNGTYTVGPWANSSFNISPSSSSFNFPTTTSPHNLDFCISHTSSQANLDIQIVTITPAQLTRPGMTAKYKIIITNTGSESHYGNINFQYDDSFMNFVAASGNSTHSINSGTGTISWNIANTNKINPFQTIEETVELLLNQPTHPTHPLNAGDVISFLTAFTDSSSNNTHLTNSLDQTIVNSYDPNDKVCIQGDVVLPSIAGKFVYYVIRFENLGNAPAINISIKDFLNSNYFKVQTFTPISSSHPMRIEKSSFNDIAFIFENINLQPSPPAPAQPIIGHVIFKVETLSSLNVGDKFSNQANIFFDFNLPVITNDFETIITQVLSTGEKELLKAELFPNPAVNYIQLKTKEAIDRVLIYDINGRLVQTALHPDKELDVSRLKKGIYAVQFIFGENKVTKKFIKE